MTRQRKLYWGIGAGSLIVCGIVLATILSANAQGRLEASGAPEPAGDENEDENAVVPVQTIRPRRDANFAITVEQPAFAVSYYQAPLEARAAGPVEFLEVDKGDKVTKGQPLLKVYVPDMVQRVAQRQASVEQRKRELDLAKAGVELAEAALQTAKNQVKETETRVKVAKADKVLRWKLWQRYRKLAAANAVTPDVVEEKEKGYEVAAADEERAEITVLTAKSNVKESELKLACARTDVHLKESLVDVAKEDKEQARIALDLATIYAPFDGVVTQRSADPGSFVHNDSRSASKPLLVVDRTDIMTVYMKVPDRYAPYVTIDTDAFIEMKELPGQVIRAKVTRFDPSLQTPEHDRTMRVEVDLYNGTADEYKRFLETEEKIKRADLKGKERRLPMFPRVIGKDDFGETHRLYPGMYGTMRLRLRQFKNTWLLPREAVVSQGGASYILQVIDGKVQRVPVFVQVDDGKLYKIMKIVKRKLADGRLIDRKVELTGDEQIVIGNQGELNDGQAVETTEIKW
jgi:multidrug resistance efflux pump